MKGLLRTSEQYTYDTPTQTGVKQMYTAQKNHNNDIIVCLGDKVEPGYWIVFRGSFFECNQLAIGNDLL